LASLWRAADWKDMAKAGEYWRFRPTAGGAVARPSQFGRIGWR
jgi:hypothetical protein